MEIFSHTLQDFGSRFTKLRHDSCISQNRPFALVFATMTRIQFVFLSYLNLLMIVSFNA